LMARIRIFFVAVRVLVVNRVFKKVMMEERCL